MPCCTSNPQKNKEVKVSTPNWCFAFYTIPVVSHVYIAIAVKCKKIYIYTYITKHFHVKDKHAVTVK